MDQLEKTAALRFVEFIQQFKVKNKPIYLLQLIAFKDSDKTTLMINMRHLIQFDVSFSTAIYRYYYRFLPYLCKAVEYLVYKHCPRLLYADGEFPQLHANDTIFLESLKLPMYNDNHRPIRHFMVAFDNIMQSVHLRHLNCSKIGELVEIIGTITRTSDVRPELRTASFSCRECGTEIKNIEQQFKYTEPKQCPDETCQNTIAFDLILQDSKFVNWQKLRFQESADEMPSGSMPRTIDIICRGDIVELAKAGDKCCISGTLLAIPDIHAFSLKIGGVEIRRGGKDQSTNNPGISGLKELGVRELNHKLIFMASNVKIVNSSVRVLEEQVVDQTESGTPSATQQSATPSGTQQSATPSTANPATPSATPAEDYNYWLDPDMLDPNEILEKCFNKQQRLLLLEMSQDTNIYANFVASIAPNVFGHDTIKKGLLLQLISGVHKITKEGMSLRGDINILLVGDPGTAKSQLLKWICNFHPRSIFTSGRASSAAGLTASVIKDEETNEFTIEAGALMLADQGICAIDEFEKMDLKDQVAIHEAMEQQTISISKAGIQATLNARTSILAAANPVFGRWDDLKPFHLNVQLTGPILSRFDLFFVLKDDCDETMDIVLSKMIANQHRLAGLNNNNNITGRVIPYSMSEMRNYIKFCRTIKPVLTTEAALYLSKSYKKLRMMQKANNGRRITVRAMESMIRLSEALARLHGQNEVHVAFAKEAYRLVMTSTLEVKLEEVEMVYTINERFEENSSEKVVVSGSDYSKIKAQMIIKLKEMVVEEGMMLRSDMVAYLMEEMEMGLVDVMGIVEMERIIKAIIKHLIVKEHVMIADKMDENGEEMVDDCRIGLNPNMVL